MSGVLMNMVTMLMVPYRRELLVQLRKYKLLNKKSAPRIKLVLLDTNGGT
jgi:hypothetical protein